MGSFFRVAYALVFCFLVNAVAGNHSCQQPRIRREWRSLEPSERADWIGAVNVLNLTILPLPKKLTGNF